MHHVIKIMSSVFAPTLFTAVESMRPATERASIERQIPQIKLSFVCDPATRISEPCTNSDMIAKIFRESYEYGEIEYREIIKVAYFNHSLKLIGVQTVGIGNQSACIPDIKGIFAGALLCRASAFALCHNHPSGTLRTSVQDDQLTRKIEDGSKILELKFIDHIVLTEDGYYSYHDEGRLN